MIVKLAPVLSKYLAENRVLRLPGVGSFYYDDAFDSEADNKKTILAANIRYEYQKLDSFDKDLIDFVSKETGKMRVLATSDLQSQLDDITQYLNTGKVYFIPGIGSLITKPDGSGFDFEPEKINTIDKRKDQISPEKNIVPPSYIDENPISRKSNKPAIIILLLTAIAIAATAWFYLKNTSKKETEEVAISSEPATTPIPDTTKTDTTKNAINTAAPGDTYKYILETAQNPRAIKRFTQLKTLNWPVELETQDSVTYRIVMKLPASGADTTRIKDSLSVLSGKKVILGQ